MMARSSTVALTEIGWGILLTLTVLLKSGVVSFQTVPGDYIGCYIDDSSRDLPDENIVGAGNTIESCVLLCASKSYQYAGLQFSTYCFCGSTYGRIGIAAADTECSMSCSGDPTEKCGGTWRNSIYQTGPVVIPLTSCAAGKFNSDPGTTTCAPCPPGYMSASGALQCTPCLSGYYAAAGSSTCTPCQPGYYSAPGAEFCTPCKAGKYSDGSVPCALCLSGSFSAVGAGTCSSCPTGQIPNPTKTGCLSKLGQACCMDEQCVDKASAGSGGMCSSKFCTCDSSAGYAHSADNTICLVKIGQACTLDTQCVDKGAAGSGGLCTSHLCVCDTAGFAASIDNIKCLVKIGQTCTLGTQCVDSGAGSGTCDATAHKCVCATNFVASPDNTQCTATCTYFGSPCPICNVSGEWSCPVCTSDSNCIGLQVANYNGVNGDCTALCGALSRGSGYPFCNVQYGACACNCEH